MRHLLAVAACAAVTLAVGAASAATLDFAFADTAGDVASGQLVTSGSAAQATVTNISGLFDGATITGVSPYAGADQQLFASSTPAFDYAGVSFAVASGVDYNLTNLGDPAGDIVNSATDPIGLGLYPVALTHFSLAAVPEPGTWALMLIGAGVAGSALRRRRSAVAA